jgi:hypothetical protein
MVSLRGGGRRALFCFVDSFHFIRRSEETTSHLLEKLESCAAAEGKLTSKQPTHYLLWHCHIEAGSRRCDASSPSLEGRAVGDLKWRVCEQK